MNIKEAADYLGISIKTLERKTAPGPTPKANGATKRSATKKARGKK